MTPIGLQILSQLTNRIPGTEGKAPPIGLVFMTNNIKVYVNLLNGTLPAGNSQVAAGYIMSLKL